MAWDGNGNFTRTIDWTDDRDAGTKILASRHDTNDNELVTGIGACLTKNNETKPTADFKPNADDSYSLGSSALRWVAGWMKALKLKTGTTYIGTLQSTNLTADRTIELPDAAGTIAVLPVADTQTLVKGSADATKLLRIEVDGLTTGTTRVLTAPDFDGTIATLAGTETLTAKTLTSPVLNTGISGTAVADQTAMEAASSNTLIVSPLSAKWHPGVAKAWVSANLSSGTPTINTSHNVSSLGDNGVGQFTVNFTTAFSTANYAPAGFVFHSAARYGICGNPATAPVAGSCACEAVRFSTEGLVDVTYAAVVFFGDQ